MEEKINNKSHSRFFALLCLLSILCWNAVFALVSANENNSVMFFLPEYARQVNTDTVIDFAKTVINVNKGLDSSKPGEEALVEESDTDEETKEAQENVQTGGVTKFYEYEPVYVNSPYYYDVGRFAVTTEYDYQTVGDDYFSDSAWIGDSRVMGIYDYSPWKDADYFCDNGYCLYNWSKQKTVTFQNTGEKVLIEDAIGQKQYGKIYIMMGINDCGYGTTEIFKENYKKLLEVVREKQPNAIIYLCANLREARSISTYEAVENNININAKNVSIAELADGVTTFYLDFNWLFTDEEGYLLDELTFDGAHLYASAYERWTQFFREHAVVR